MRCAFLASIREIPYTLGHKYCRWNSLSTTERIGIFAQTRIDSRGQPLFSIFRRTLKKTNPKPKVEARICGWPNSKNAKLGPRSPMTGFLPVHIRWKCETGTQTSDDRVPKRWKILDIRFEKRPRSWRWCPFGGEGKHVTDRLRLQVRRYLKWWNASSPSLSHPLPRECDVRNNWFCRSSSPRLTSKFGFFRASPVQVDGLDVPRGDQAYSHQAKNKISRNRTPSPRE